MNTGRRIIILDNGAPISPEIIEALAGRGIRVDTSAPQQHKLFEQHKEEEDMRASQIMAALLGAGLRRSGFQDRPPARELLPKAVQAAKLSAAQAKRERKNAQRLRITNTKHFEHGKLITNVGVPAPRDTVAPLTIVTGEEN